MKLGVRQVWSTLFALSLFVVLWAGIVCSARLIDYFRKASLAAPLEIEWSVQSSSQDVHHVMTHYLFAPEGNEIKSSYLFDNKSYRTKEAAEEAIALMRKEPWQVYWYGSLNAPHASLEKNFPLKQCIHFLIALGVAVYFRWIRQKLYVHIVN